MIKRVARCFANEVKFAFYNVRAQLAYRGLGSPVYETELARQIGQSGCVVLENYWARDKALRVRDQIAELHGSEQPFVLGDYKQDEVVRIYHVERLFPELTEFRFDPLVLKVAGIYNGFSSFSGALVYQHDTVYGREKSHYHVDSFVRQFKAMMYLDDVDVGNGPFSFIPSSHKERGLMIRKQLSGNSKSKVNVFEEAQLEFLLSREVQVCAPAGSLLLMDVTGIHRGAPQTETSRSVLMNYIMPRAGDIYLDKNLPEAAHI